jgi:1,2-diacylglycerol 3-beta-glucosyltransferase
MLSGLQTFEHGLTLFLVGFGLAYFFAGVLLGYRHWERAKRVDDATLRSDHPYAVFFLVAALDEAKVIGDTVRSLVANPDVTVVLVDDGSTDNTAGLALAASEHRCLVVTRTLPDARLGKGAALNAGFMIVREEVARRALDARHTLVCVMDADGHLSAGALERVKVLFDDQKVGGVQLPVRIRNRRRPIERLQDLEFWALSALSQFARVAFGNVSLGGNGQFTRLSVLLELDDAPWSASLTEDLDLAVRITLGGHRLVSTPMAWVDQQAITSWRRLIRQRTRWMQGHMTCGAYIWRLLRSPNVTNPAAVETVLYLSVPWILVLPWSILFHVTWTQTIISIARYGLPIHAAGVVPVIGYCIYLYLVSFLPMIVAGLLYGRRDPSIGWVRSVILGHLLIAGFYVAMIAAWRAVFRMLRGKGGWEKTPRHDDEELVAVIPPKDGTPVEVFDSPVELAPGPST